MPSGFLGDYEGIEPTEREGLLVYGREEGVLRDYRAFLVDRPLIYFHPEARGVGVDPRDLEMLSSHLYDLLVEAITASGFEIVEEPGPGVARFRTAITDVVPIDPAKNIGAKAAGAVLGVGLLVPRVDMGSASVEAEIVDAGSGERLVALVATRQARRFGGIVKGSKEWGDVKAAFKKWTKALEKRLSSVHTPDATQE